MTASTSSSRARTQIEKKHVAFALVVDFLKKQGYHHSLDALHLDAPEYFTGRRETSTLYDCHLPSAEVLKQPTVVDADENISLLVSLLCQWSEDREREECRLDRREMEQDESFFMSLQSDYKMSEQRRLHKHERIHDANMVALCAVPFDLVQMPAVMSAAADQSLKWVQVESGEAVSIEQAPKLHQGPILSISFHPLQSRLVLTTSMDGSHALSRLTLNDPIDPFHPPRLDLVHRWTDHQRYVVKAQFSADGRYFATASYDRTLSIYECGDPLSEQPEYQLVHSRQFTGRVEGLCFVQTEPQAFVATVRDCHYMYYILLPSFEEQRYTMNASEGDDHVSFTAMHLSVCPFKPTRNNSVDGTITTATTSSEEHPGFLLVSTDQSNGHILLFRLFSSRIVRECFGPQNDGFSQVRHTWHPDGSHFYVTSDQDWSVWVFRVGDGKCVRKLGGSATAEGVYSGEGHRGIVRDLVYLPSPANVLVTCSYDRTLGVWQ